MFKKAPSRDVGEPTDRRPSLTLPINNSYVEDEVNKGGGNSPARPQALRQVKPGTKAPEGSPPPQPVRHFKIRFQPKAVADPD